MRLLATLLVLGGLSFLQLATGRYYGNDPRIVQTRLDYRGGNYSYIPNQLPDYNGYYYSRNGRRHVDHRYGNSSYVWGQRQNDESLMLTARVAHSDEDLRKYMSGRSTPNMRYSYMGKVSIDTVLPLTKHEFECPISYIELQSLTRTVGFASITRGGLGHRFVFLHFESNINCSMDFSVRVYGVCCEPPTTPRPRC